MNVIVQRRMSPVAIDTKQRELTFYKIFEFIFLLFTLYTEDE